MRWSLLALVFPALVFPAACAPTSQPKQPTDLIPLDDEARWPYWPVDFRIHPLSRLVATEDEGIQVEARLEFLDRDGQSSRAYGQIRLEVHDATGPRLVNGERSWNPDLRDLDQNAVRFEEVLKTYVFRLRTDWTELPADAVLHVWYLGVNGEHPQRSLALRGPQSP